MQILGVNPGAASAKIAVFSDGDPIVPVSRSGCAETKPLSIAPAAAAAGV